ncbi:helix-turn-helix domain-containing protein [Tsukamurella ocularis]
MPQELPPNPAIKAAEDVRVGSTVRVMREMRGYRPDEFASTIGISRPYLANIEAGRKHLTEVLLARTAKALDVPQIAIRRPLVETPAVPA